jgi:hypothetical protein
MKESRMPEINVEVITDRTFTLTVNGIRVQKDEYQIEARKKLGETVFWKSDANEAEVLSFKRAKVDCRLTSPGIDIAFQLIISLRAGFVRLRLTSAPTGTSATATALLLRHLLKALFHTPGYKPEGVLAPIGTREDSRYVLCKTYDSNWLAATMHEIADEKGMSFEVSASGIETTGLLRFGA